VLSEECPAKLERNESEVGRIVIMYFVYILKLKNGNYYAGSTPNIKERFKEHTNGYCRSTKDCRPVKLTFYAAFENKETALKFERYLKSSSGEAFRNRRLV